MAPDSSDKGGGFGSLPGDLFKDLITYFETTPPLSQLLEPFRIKILAQAARTEHAAANAEKVAYVVDVAVKSVSIQENLLKAKDAINSNDNDRATAMNNILTTLAALQQLWV